MIAAVVAELAAAHDVQACAEMELSIPGGEELAAKTWNGRLGIVGGLSILGTTGIVHPYSCSAWIHSIHSGIDVARAAGISHVAGSTGSTSEAAVRKLYNLPLEALIDMGDFAGGLLKYVRDHPVPRLTVAGGFGKMTKLAQGALDLHSARSQVDFGWLAGIMPERVREQVRHANTAQEVEELARAHRLRSCPARGARGSRNCPRSPARRTGDAGCRGHRPRGIDPCARLSGF